MFETLFPKPYGFSAFFVKVTPTLTFRIFKLEHLFSTVGATYMFQLYVSFRHLSKLRHFKWSDKNSICFECDVNTGIKILEDLKKTGFSDISFLFSL